MSMAEVQPDPETHYPDRKIGSLVEEFWDGVDEYGNGASK